MNPMPATYTHFDKNKVWVECRCGWRTRKRTPGKPPKLIVFRPFPPGAARNSHRTRRSFDCTKLVMNITDKFLQAYIVAALWSSMDESTPEGGEPLDKNYGPDDLAPETLEKMKADCVKFQAETAQDIEGNEEQAGHDFWLTRNHHGCGFWDGDWPEAGDRLTQACKAYPEVTLYVGDDGLIYC